MTRPDRLAAALGSCIATNIEPVAERHGIEFDRIRITVTKSLSRQPKRIDSFGVHIRVNGELDPDVAVRLERVAHHCLVHQSLADHVAVGITMETGSRSRST